MYIGPTSPSPTYLTDNFDPLKESNWIFRDGSQLLPFCNPPGVKALTFGRYQLLQNRVTSRDVYMVPDLIVLMNETLRTNPVTTNNPLFPTVTGFITGQSCGLPLPGLVFSQPGERTLITADFNTTASGLVLSFTFAYGGGCDLPDTGVFIDEDIYFAFSTDGGNSWTTIMRLAAPTSQGTCAQTYSGLFLCVNRPITVNISLDSVANGAMRSTATRFRLLQSYDSTPSPQNVDVWAVTNFTMVTQPFLNYTLQFDVIMTNLSGCNAPYSDANPLLIEQSFDRGNSWRTITPTCLPVAANGCAVWNQEGRLDSSSYRTWSLVTLNLGINPGPSVRFRWSLAGGAAGQAYALDNVFAGLCGLTMCSGRGLCQPDSTCVCRGGYSGPDCSVAPPNLPSWLYETFASYSSTPLANWPSSSGKSEVRSSFSPDCLSSHDHFHNLKVCRFGIWLVISTKHCVVGYSVSFFGPDCLLSLSLLCLISLFVL